MVGGRGKASGRNAVFQKCTDCGARLGRWKCSYRMFRRFPWLIRASRKKVKLAFVANIFCRQSNCRRLAIIFHCSFNIHPNIELWISMFWCWLFHFRLRCKQFFCSTHLHGWRNSFCDYIKKPSKVVMLCWCQLSDFLLPNQFWSLLKLWFWVYIECIRIDTFHTWWRLPQKHGIMKEFYVTWKHQIIRKFSDQPGTFFLTTYRDYEIE